ncbi:MAG: UDP-glucose/GDP-mannose dehydrogenase family protein [Candidatus Omnitrophica bacterium]|nr:UDP-glucose/GDP-mannose dehydrogenase family protein [Candidatus Omnitrophota bacterium]
MNIAIIGTGYVGLVSGTCFAELGNDVICVDNNKEKIASLNKGVVPIYEPGLEELIRKNRRKNRLRFTSCIKEAVEKTKIIFIAVGTPPKLDGGADLRYIEQVSRDVARYMNNYKVVVEKSTVPVETNKWVKYIMRLNNHKIDFDVASNPEFLKEGSAISDFMNPDRVVLGVESERAKKLLLKLYKPLKAPIVVTNIQSAEIIKHASNSFLATKISFINSVANICEKVGADIEKVAEGMGLDKRIGSSFLNAGVGYGGSCFPKDVQAFVRIAERLGCRIDILKEVEKINKQQRKLIFSKIEKALWIINGKNIGVLGIAFKPNTDDIRSAPAIDIIKMLQGEGAKIRAYDPKAMEHAKKILPNVDFCKNSYDAARGADALVIMTEWDSFKKIDFAKMKKIMRHPIIIDARNMLDPKKMKKMGFNYTSVGRPGHEIL